MDEKIVVFVDESRGDDNLNPPILSLISKEYPFPVCRTSTFTLAYMLNCLVETFPGESLKSKNIRSSLFYNLKYKFEKRLMIYRNDLCKFFELFPFVLKRMEVGMVFIDAYLLNQRTIKLWMGYFDTSHTKFVYHEIGKASGSSKYALVKGYNFNMVMKINTTSESPCLEASVRYLKPIIGF